MERKQMNGKETKGVIVNWIALIEFYLLLGKVSFQGQKRGERDREREDLYHC